MTRKGKTERKTASLKVFTDRAIVIKLASPCIEIYPTDELGTYTMRFAVANYQTLEEYMKGQDEEE